MALSRGAAQTARRRRLMLALTAVGGTAGLVVVGEKLREAARENEQTSVEYAQERIVEATRDARQASGVAAALLRTVVSSALDAVQQRQLDTGHFHAALATTMADLVADPSSRRQLVALGGGVFMDWLLNLAYPEHLQPAAGRTGAGAAAAAGREGEVEGAGAATERAYGTERASSGSGSGLIAERFECRNGVERGGALEAAAAGGASGADGGRALRLAAGEEEWEGAAALAPGSREAERALESLLEDDTAARQLLGRPGAVPRLLRAVAGGRASGAVAAALARRAAEARAADEAMTADLRETVDMLRGRGGGGGVSSSPRLQRLACGLLAAWAAGSGSNRAKLTGLGLQGVVADVMTAVSGLGDRAAVELQWELLRLARVMAEHSSSSDSHHLASCVLPLLYTAADAAAAADAAMASYAIDTLAAAVQHGGPPVAGQVANSTMSHLLWQLADGMAAVRTVTAAAAAEPPPPPEAAAPGSSASASAPPPAAGRRSWLVWSRGPADKGKDKAAVVAGKAAAGGGGGGVAASGEGGGGGAGPAAAAAGTASVRRAGSVWVVKDPALAAAVAAAVGQLAAAGLLPEAQVPRWRDWLLDLLCGEGFEPVREGQHTTQAASAAATGTGAVGLLSARAAAGHQVRAGGVQAEGGSRLQSPPRGLRVPEPAAGAAGGSSSSRAPNGGEPQPRALPAWLTLPSCGGGGRGWPASQAAALEGLRGSVVAALAALSQVPGNHGLQAAHYWLSRLLSELAARTLPYTSLVYAEGPRDPQELVHVVPVLPSYVRSVADALEKAADAVAEDAPPLPPHLEFELAGSGLVGRAPHFLEEQRAAAAAYRRAAHVVDVVVAERKAADALEALCAIVAPDPGKQLWLLQRGMMPLMHRLTRTADDPRVTLAEEGQPGAEQVEEEQAAAAETAVAATLPPGSPKAAPTAANRLHNRAPQATSLGSNQQPRAQHAQHVQPAAAKEAGTKMAAASSSAPTATAAAGPAAAAAAPELMSDHAGGPSLCLQRQVARMLALLALLPEAQEELGATGGGGGGAAAAVRQGLAPRESFASEDWLGWLRHSSTSTDCRLSSNATRALLHAAAVAAAGPAAAPASSSSAPTFSPPPPPVFHDGIHLLDPTARHHWALVRRTSVATAEAAVAAGARAAAVVAAARAPGRGEMLHGSTGAPVTAMAAAEGSRQAAAARVISVGEIGSGGSGGASAARPAAVATVGLPAQDAVSNLYGALLHAASLPWALLCSTAALAGGGLAAAFSAGRGGGPDDAPSAAALPGMSWLAASAATVSEPLYVVQRGSTAAPGLVSSPSDDAHGPPPSGGGDSGGGSGSSAGGGDPHTAGHPPAVAPATGAPGPAAPASLPPPPVQLPLYPAPYPADGDAAASDAAPPHALQQSHDGEEPTVDVVFIHGIRGGPFITWRKAGVMTRGSAASHMERSACWPSTWLAEDFPGARLLSVEYLAPVSAWEGESLPLEDNVSRVMGQLAAAGVGSGERPVVFVAHSMGGLLVKEMLARSMEQAGGGGGPNAALAASTRGIVFFGTPHFGNALAAMGWKLRHVPGAHPAPSLARLTPGPHLMSLNERLRELHDCHPGQLRVVSMLEGQATQLSGVIPRILVVAPDSAYPGFGAGMVLPDNDHIDCCKPASKAAPSYRVVRDVVRHALRVGAVAVAPGAG